MGKPWGNSKHKKKANVFVVTWRVILAEINVVLPVELFVLDVRTLDTMLQSVKLDPQVEKLSRKRHSM